MPSRGRPPNARRRSTAGSGTIPPVKLPVGTIVCPGCGGGAPETAKACPYCGAKVVLSMPAAATSSPGAPPVPKHYCPRCAQFYASSLPACPRCLPASPDARGGRCPRCKTDLAPASTNGVPLDTCATCQGRWFDGGEIERLLDVSTKGKSREEVASLREALPRRPSPIEKSTLECVRCRAPMTRRQIALKSGVVVDVCRAHGIWFDGGEWEQFGEFVRAGGLEVLRREQDVPHLKGLKGRTGPMSRRTFFPGDDSGGGPGIGFLALELLAGIWH